MMTTMSAGEILNGNIPQSLQDARALLLPWAAWHDYLVQALAELSAIPIPPWPVPSNSKRAQAVQWLRLAARNIEEEKDRLRG